MEVPRREETGKYKHRPCPVQASVNADWQGQRKNPHPHSRRGVIVAEVEETVGDAMLTVVGGAGRP